MIFGGFNVGSNVQEQIPCTFRGCGREEYKNDCGSSFLSAKVREIGENV